MSAAVVRRDLASTVIGRGSVVVADEIAITTPARAEGQTASVVTRAPVPVYREAVAGRAVVEINGRPLLVLAMAVPLYRDITPGATGPDVVSLQHELARLGHLIPPGEAGTFGPASQAAVDRVFAQAGYEAIYTTGSRAALEAGRAQAEQAVGDAIDAANRSRADGVIEPALESAVAAAEADRAEFAATQGVVLRSAEVVRVAAVPAVLVGAVPAVGTSLAADQVVATLGSPHPQVRIQLDAAQGAPVSKRTTVELEGGAYAARCHPIGLVPVAAPAGAPVDAPPDSSADAPVEGDTTDRPEAGVELAASCAPAPSLRDLGADYTATLRTKVAHARLVVPATSLVSMPDGGTFVQVERPGGRLARVQVAVVAEAAGLVSIDVRRGHLAEGDRVRVRRG